MAEVDSESLINQAIEARKSIEEQRAQVQEKRSALINQLKSTGGRRSSHTAAAINAEIRALDSEERHLDRQEQFTDTEARTRMTSAFRNAQMADKHLEVQRHTQTAEQASNILLGMADIEAKYKHGTPEFHDAVVNLVGQNPLGMSAAQARDRVLQATTFHDKEAERTRNVLAASLFKQTGLSPEQFAQATNIRATTADVKTTDHAAIEKARSDKGNTIAADINGQTFLFQKGLFNNYSSHFRQQPTQQGITPAPPSADEQAQLSGFRSAEQAQGYLQGKPLLDFAPLGTVSFEKGQPTKPGQLPGGGYFSNAPIPKSTVSQTPEGGRDEIARATEASNQGIQPPPASPQVTQVTTGQQPNPLSAPTNPAERVQNAIYSTPKGNLRWSDGQWFNP